MAILTELKYRQFDDLLDSVKIDFKGVDLEGYIEPQELIKVALKINKDLGVRINNTKEGIVEIGTGKGKLPADFHLLNFALVCESKNTYPLIKVSKTQAEIELELLQFANEHFLTTNLKEYNNVVTIKNGSTIVTHNLNTNDLIIQIKDSNGNVLLFDFIIIDNNEISISDFSGTEIVDADLKVIGRNRTLSASTSCTTLDMTTSDPTVKYIKNNVTNVYQRLLSINMKKHQDVLRKYDTVKIRTEYEGSIKNNFFYTNFEEGEIYVNYVSVMEDDEGNLLVLDNPIINEYYEYALKERIFENMFASGEPNVQQRLQYFSEKLRVARINANSYVNTPDFNELKTMWETNRKAQMHRFYNMFRSRVY